MSSQILPISPASSLLDDVADYAAKEPVPHVPWLSRLELDQPRRNIHCLGAGTRCIKRIVDVAGAGILLVALSPILLLVAVLVKLTSRGPIIFKQVRVGLNLRGEGDDRRLENLGPPEGLGERRRWNRRAAHAYGRHFTLYKFRTMRIDAEKFGAQFSSKNDPRVTPLGRIMRKTRLDELPQLWNVLKGEMSLVGPRPERPEFMERLSAQVPSYLDRLGLKPGLTGVAQVVNGYDNDIPGFRRKIVFDLLYLQNCSLWNDLKILVRTIGVVLKGSGV